MNLIENEEAIKKRKKAKIIMAIIIVLIVILLAVSVFLLYMISEVQRSTLKLNVDNKSTSFAEDLFVFEDDKLYVAIKDFGQLMGYTPYNGDYKNRRYSETTTECYISTPNEIASYSLNSNTMYKKASINDDYEYFDLEEPVKLINDKLYVIKDGIEIGTNCIIQYNASNNQISVISLDYLVSYYANKFNNAVVINEDANFNNKKALRYDLVVFQNTDGLYGVYNSDGTEIIGPKYTNIIFKEDSQEFTVTTEENKMGILSTDGTTKIEPNYDEIKQISKDLNYYLVSNNKKYGVINHNGNIVIYLEYDKIGIDESRFNSNGIDNAYILFGKCIPVFQNNKWGIYDIDGKVVLPLEYDSIGCLVGSQNNNISSNNVVVIPQYEGIVVGQGEQYGIYSSDGERYVPVRLDSVYSQTINGEEKYYMNVTLPTEENGEIVDKQYTYDVDEYFSQFVIEPPESLEENVNSLGGTSVNETVDGNTEVTNTDSQETDANTQDTSTEPTDVNVQDTNVEATDTNV